MRRFWVIVGGALAAAALLVAPAGARVQTASGDVCTASGSGTQVTLHITIPPGQQQYGFAFRTSGASIRNASIPGTNGSFSTATETLAPNTSAGWFSDAPLPGSSVVTLTTSGPAKSITIVPSVNATRVNGGSTPATGQTAPSSSSAPTFLDPVTCTASSAAPARTATFTVDPRAIYSPAAKAWRLVVRIPGPGTVSAAQPVPTIGTGYAKPATAKPLVQAHRMSLTTAGSVTLTLKPTSKGQTALAQRGSFRVRLRVTFDAENGASAHKSVTLRLAR